MGGLRVVFFSIIHVALLVHSSFFFWFVEFLLFTPGGFDDELFFCMDAARASRTVADGVWVWSSVDRAKQDCVVCKR